jgi:uncharacterized repeat protein (TIGR01451 family)
LVVTVSAMLAWPSPVRAAFPGENGRGVFTSVPTISNPSEGGPPEVYTRNADGSDLRRLTNNDRDDGDPTFSPDGEKIAWGDGRAILTMNTDGTVQRALTAGGISSYSGPDYSPGGGKIAFTGGFDAYVMNADGSDPRALTDTGDGTTDYEPAFSPDGSTIAFTTTRDSVPGKQNAVYTMGANGEGQTRFTSGTTPNWQPANPDLSVIASDRPDPVRVGQDLTYSFTVANNGRTGAPGVTLTSRLPAGVTFAPASDRCRNDSGAVRCNLGDLARGASTTVEVVVGPSAQGPITGTTTVASNVRDAYPLDNTDRATTQVNRNRAPVAEPDSYAVAEDETLTVAAPGVLRNDADADGDPLTAALVSGPRNGTLSLRPNGSFVYTPGRNFFGQNSFTYRASDGKGGQSKAAIVRIAVRPVAEPPPPTPPRRSPGWVPPLARRYATAPRR